MKASRLELLPNVDRMLPSDNHKTKQHIGKVIFTSVIFFSFFFAASLPSEAEATASMRPPKAKVFVRVDNVGGFLPLEYIYTQTPSTLLVDTKLYRPGAVVMIYPGPALLPIEERTVSSTSAEVKARSVYSALVTPKGGWGTPGVADAPSAVISVTVDGKTRTATIASYGFTNVGNGLSAVQAAARSKLQTAINSIDGLKGTSRMFKPVNLEAWVFEDGAWYEPGSTPEETPVDPLPWPSTVSVNDGCNSFPPRLLPVGSNQISRFSSDARVFRAVFRPVLPGESACKRAR